MTSTNTNSRIAEPKLTEAQAMAQSYAINQFTSGQQQIQIIANKLLEMEMKQKEAEQVIQILTKVPKERRCWYSMDGILIEMTVDEVLPKLFDNLAILKRDINSMAKEIDSKKDMLAEYALRQKLIQPIYKTGTTNPNLKKAVAQ